LTLAISFWNIWNVHHYYQKEEGGGLASWSPNADKPGNDHGNDIWHSTSSTPAPSDDDDGHVQQKQAMATSTLLDMLQEYQQWHSHQALLEEEKKGNRIQNRTFVIGLCGCPDSAGNRLFEFFNAMVVAIAHDYTISWKFMDEVTCRQIGTKSACRWCKNFVNTVQLCDELIERSSWIPSYDDWEAKLNFTSSEKSFDNGRWTGYV